MEWDKDAVRARVAHLQAALSPYRTAKLMAVVKTRTAEEINFVIRECGVSIIGENRVQELLAHWDALDRRASLHFIGTLQTNKVKYIIDKVDMIESLDSLGLAAEIEKRAAACRRVMPVCIEINIGNEPSKGGIAPEELGAFCEAIAKLPHLRPMGLMTVAPVCSDEREARCYFAAMRALASDVFAAHFPSETPPLLSMGMSDSYRAALEEGATIVRIGTGIFGKRPVFDQK